jgi:tetratricopeptide (TPR) repeat protein
VRPPSGGQRVACVEYGSLLLREAEVAHGTGQLERARALADDALALGRSLGSDDLEAEALQAKGRVRIDQGHLDDGMGHLDEAMLLAVEGRLRPYSTGKVYCSLIAACEQVDDFDRAAEWTEATMRWAQRHPFAIFPGICRVHRAIVLKRRGALAEAEREAVLACEELRQSHLANSAAAFAEVGDIRRRLGDLDEAERAFTRAQEIRGAPCGGLAVLRLAQGRVDEALAMITACVGDASNRLARAGLLPMLVHVAVAAGQLDVASSALAELEEITAAFDTPTLRATAGSTRGRLQLAQGDPAAADSLRQAADAWRALDVPYEEATARTLLGQALRHAGDEPAAEDAFAAATALFDQIGAHLDARLVTGGMRATFPAGLTERDRSRAVPERQDRVAAPLEHLHQDRRHLASGRHRLCLRAPPRGASALRRRGQSTRTTSTTTSSACSSRGTRASTSASLKSSGARSERSCATTSRRRRPSSRGSPRRSITPSV